MPHIELSLSPRDNDTSQPLAHSWTEPVRASADACLLLNERGVVIASSPSCRALLGLAEGIDSHQRKLLDGLELVNFAASGGSLPHQEALRIPPLQAIETGALSRGLLRVSAGGLSRTLDAIATPLHGGTEVAGSLTFFRRC